MTMYDKSDVRSFFRQAVAVVVFAFSPMCQFILLESFIALPFTYTYMMAFFVSVMLIVSVELFLAFLFRSLRVSYLVVNVVLCFLGTVSRYLYLIRGVPLQSTDIAAIRTAAVVFSRYDLTPDEGMIAVWIFFAAFALFLFFGWRSYDAIGGWFRTRTLKQRILCLLLCVVLFFGVCQIIVWDYARRVGKSSMDFYDAGPITMVTPLNTRCMVGSFYDWIGMPYVNRLTEPEGYDEWEAFDDLFEPDSMNLADMPDVIVVMNEAFSDPDDYGGAHALTEYMPFLKSFGSSSNTRLGSLDVSVIAGNTCNTEWEALLGTSMACFVPYSTPYQYAATKELPSLARYFSQMGYETWAAHPHDHGNWNRNNVYQRMGFDKVLFMDRPCDGIEFPDTSGTFDPDTMNEDLLTDEECFRVIREILDKRADDGIPRFIFVVTIQNHGDYFRHFEGLEFDVRVDDEAIAAQIRPDDELAMIKYLSLMKRSDTALHGFCDSLSERSDIQGFGSLVAFFGDHQPDASAHWPFERNGGIDPGNPTSEQNADFYKVPYGLWSTYDLPDDLILGRKSVCYMGLDLFQALGRGKPGYYSFLSEMLERVPVYSGVRTETDGTDEAVSMIQDFRMWQWWRISDPDGWKPVTASTEGGDADAKR